MNKKEHKQNIILYQAKSGKIEFRGDITHETIWATLQQIAELFGVQKPAVSKQ